MDMGSVLYVIGGAAIVALLTFLDFRKSSKKEGMAFLEKQVLTLFLYAEKQDWINEDKMGWVVQQVYNRVPAKILKLAAKFFDQEDVEKLVEHLYQQAKDRLEQDSKLQ